MRDYDVTMEDLSYELEMMLEALVCDGYIEELRRKMPCKKLAIYI